jgi:hypothetical protein
VSYSELLAFFIHAEPMALIGVRGVAATGLKPGVTKWGRPTAKEYSHRLSDVALVPPGTVYLITPDVVRGGGCGTMKWSSVGTKHLDL